MVYVDAKPFTVKLDDGGNAVEILSDIIDDNKRFYTCGADIDLAGSNLPPKARPFVRLKLNCASPPEIQLFSSDVLSSALRKTTCGWCGLPDGELQPNNEGGASIPLPVCAPCLTQMKKARSSGKVKFNLGGVAPLCLLLLLRAQPI